MKNSVLPISLLLILFCAAAWGAADDDPDLVLITGEHWSQASANEKEAYLFGIGNVLEVEQAMHGKNPSDMLHKNSIVPVLINGLSNLSTEQVRQMLDQWYGKHPDQLKRPVLEVLYIEFALPNISAKSN